MWLVSPTRNVPGCLVLSPDALVLSPDAIDAEDEDQRGGKRLRTVALHSELRNRRARALPRLSKDPVDDMTFDVGESEIASAVAVCQAFVVKAEQMQNCGVQIMHMHLVFRRVKSKLV